MQSRNTLVEDIIREEVRNIMNSRQVPSDDLSEEHGDEVPISDLPAGMLEEYGLTTNQSGLESDTTVSAIKAGEAVEPNEALEGSVLDPLTNVLLGGLIKGATEVAPAFRRSMIGNRVKDATTSALNKTKSATKGGAPVNLSTMVDNLAEASSQSQSMAGKGLDSVSKLFGGRIGSIAKSAKNTLDRVVDPITAPISEAAAVRYKTRVMRSLMDKGIPQKEANAIADDLLKELKIETPFLDKASASGRLFNDPIIKQSAKGAVANELFGD